LDDLDHESVLHLDDRIMKRGFYLVIRNTWELSRDQKAAIKSLPGCSVREDEEISVRAIEPTALSSRRRKELAEELKKYFAEVDARRQPGSPEEAEEILNEAISAARPSYRNHISENRPRYDDTPPNSRSRPPQEPK
jgi:hypothetical protein